MSTAPVIRETGTGPALLLLHAYPLDSSQWDAQVAALSGRYRCLRPDFYGCGGAPPPPAGVTIDGCAGALLDELARRGVEQFSVCANSMGGYLAFALWRAAPQRVRALVLANTRAAADDATARAARAAQAEQVRSGGVEAIVESMTARLLCTYCQGEAHVADPVRGRVRRCSAEGVLAAIAAIADRPDSIPTLATITVPTMVVCGTADVVVPLAEARAMAAAIPGARLQEFEGCGHVANLEQPQRFSQVLGDFLDEVGAQNM